jgi:mono/diheme cytochrome c family protein
MKHSVVLTLGAVILMTGCFREMPTEKPPIHLNQNMDDQEKFEPYEKNTFFSDGSAMRMPVPGTVARDDVKSDTAFYQGKTESGKLVDKNPLSLTTEVMERGQERYNIYCRPCHGSVGDGQGIVYLRGRDQGFVPPTNFHTDLMRGKTDGHFYDVITNGVRNMMPYRYQINEEDRWAIVHYVRALQRSQNATENDIPASMKNKVK